MQINSTYKITWKFITSQFLLEYTILNRKYTSNVVEKQHLTGSLSCDSTGVTTVALRIRSRRVAGCGASGTRAPGGEPAFGRCREGGALAAGAAAMRLRREVWDAAVAGRGLPQALEVAAPPHREDAGHGCGRNHATAQSRVALLTMSRCAPPRSPEGGGSRYAPESIRRSGQAESRGFG